MIISSFTKRNEKKQMDVTCASMKTESRGKHLVLLVSETVWTYMREIPSGTEKGEAMANYKCKYEGLNSNSKLYRAWASMKSRCSNPNDPSYERYGARGITVCDEWMDFAGFKKWALANGYKEDVNHMRDCSLDRINNNGNYEPNNCRWATAKEQTNNTRKNVRIQYNGEEHTLAEWARIKGMSYTTFMNRYQRGWSFERIMETPKGNYREVKSCQ